MKIKKSTSYYNNNKRMMIHPTVDSNTIPYSTTNTTMVSGNIG